MKNKYFIFTAFFLFCIFFSSAQNTIGYSEAIEQLSRKKEVYFKAEINDSEQLSFLTKIISIDNVKYNKQISVYGYANSFEFQKFLKLNIPHQILEHPGDKIKAPKMYPLGTRSIKEWDAYPTYPAYIDLMYQFQALYPGLCQIICIGTTAQGRKLLFAKISDNAEIYESEPRFMFTSTMHGDEVTGYVLMLRLIDYLLDDYGNNPAVTNLVDNLEIWINPLENPDGTYAGGDMTVSGATRNNGNNIDLNRNYPNPLEGMHHDGNSWQPEALAMMELLDSIHFVMAANFHGGAEVVNYPWDTWTSAESKHADDLWWQFISGNYANTVFQFSPAGYFTSVSSDGTTNGGDWYIVYGSRQDYNTYFRYGREATIEISNEKMPLPEDLPAYWDYNYRSFLSYMQQALYGIHGFVTDSMTGEPLVARVFMVGHDKDNSHVFSELPDGVYFRPLYSGNYMVTFSCSGYRSKTISLTVTNSSSTLLNVQLVDLDLLPPLADFTANKTEDNCNGIIEFINLSSASAETTWLWNFGDSSTSAEQNPVHVYHGSGIYNVSLFASNSIGNHFTAKPNFIVINLPQEPVVSSASSCDTSAVLELYGAGNGTLHWYDNETGGNLLYTGDTLVTPLLYSSTVYYVEDRISPPSRFVGKEDNSGQGEYYNYNIPQYLVFDCFSSVLLKSVKVYAGSQGNRTIELHDSTGTILDSVTVNIPAGESRITLDFTLPEENNLRLVSPPMPDLFRNKEIFTNLDYPFQLYDTLSIKGNSANDLKYYYFFYDWEIIGLNDCFSSRIPVWAVINDSAIAGFSYLINNMHVSFNNSSQYFTECVWDFGDGQFSYENNPVHTYLSDGTYTVMLVAQNSCYADTLVKTIIISGINEYEKNCFNIYPIPARDKVFIELPEMFNKPIKITVYDIYGNVIYRTEYYQINSQRIEVRLSGSARGIYFVQISTLETVQYSKIIIQLY